MSHRFTPNLASRRASSMVLALSLVLAGSAFAQTAKPGAQIAKGQRLFLKCASCHEIAVNNIVKSGPRLNGIVGRKVASLEAYAYSESLKSLTFNWDESHLDQWLEQPTKVAAGTTMAFIGLPSPEERKALIAYLKTIK